MDKEKELLNRIAELEAELEQAKVIMEAQHETIMETQPTYYYEQIGYALGVYNIGDEGVEQSIVVRMPLTHGLELYARIANN